MNEILAQYPEILTAIHTKEANEKIRSRQEEARSKGVRLMVTLVQVSTGSITFVLDVNPSVLEVRE